MNVDEPAVCARFRDYAGTVRPALDAAFEAELDHLLGDTRPLRDDGAYGVLTGG